MPHIERTAHVGWDGNLARGAGTLDAGTGAFARLPFSLPSRVGDPGGKTSPEELLAAAHAACFCMAFSNELSTSGHPPARLDVTATATFVGGKITRMRLEVSADVPGADEAALQEALAAAEQSCPVSNALRGNVDIETKTV